MKTILLYFFLGFSIHSFSQNLSNFPFSKSMKISKYIIAINDSNYWHKVDPIKFLDTLICYGENYIFRIEVTPPNDWYNPISIQKLNEYENNNFFSASVITFLAEEFGDITCGSTTISQEAKYLIEGIKRKKYPFSRGSSCYFNKKK